MYIASVANIVWTYGALQSLPLRLRHATNQVDTLDGYLFNMRLLRTIFNIEFDLHTIEVTDADLITARC